MENPIKDSPFQFFFINKIKEKLHVLQVLDNFFCEEDENFDEKDSQL